MKLRKFGMFFMLMVAWLVAHGQPTTAIKLNQLETAPQVSGRRDGQIGLSGTSGKQAYANYVEVNLSPIAYTPATSGNTSNLSQFVEDPSGDWWYIDWQGNAHQFLAGSGGNGIYGGDGTLPSPGGSDVTVPDDSPLSFFVDNEGGGFEDILRLNTDYTSDDARTSYIVFKSPVDSLKIEAYDGGTEFQHTGFSTSYMKIQSNQRLKLSADSIMIEPPTTSTRLASSSERTYLVLDTIQGTIARRRGIPPSHLQQAGATTGQVLAWDGTQYAPAASSSAGTVYQGVMNADTVATYTSTNQAIGNSMGVTLPAGSYALEAVLYIGPASTGQPAFDMSIGTASGSPIYANTGVSISIPTSTTTARTSTQTGVPPSNQAGAIGTAPGPVQMRGVLTLSTGGGVGAIIRSTSAASGNNYTIFKGSYIKFTKIL